MIRAIAIACWVIWYIVWIATWFFTKRTKWQQDVAGRSGYGILLWFGFFFTIVSLAHPDLLGLPFALIPALPAIRGIGLAIDIIGLIFCVWARFALGRNWSRSLDLKEGHELVTHGPYAVTRNPIYTGLLMMFLGCMLITGELATIVGFCFALASCLIRIPLEERLMRQEFPDAYVVYAQKVKKLVPLVW